MNTETITEPVSSTTAPIVDNSSEWLKVDQFRDVSIPDDYRKVSMFNRMVYTIDDDGIVAPKYNKVNLLIKTIDDLSLYDLSSCVRRIGPDTYASTIPIKVNGDESSKSEDIVCVLGIISEEFITNNELREFEISIEDLSKFNIVSLTESDIDINDPQAHVEAFDNRVGKNFIRKLDALRELDQFK